MNRLMWWTRVVVLLGAFAVSLPSATDAQPAGKKAQKVPQALVDFGEFAENIYDFSKSSDWAKASEKFKALRDAAEALPGDLKETKAEKKRRDETLAALGKALGAKEKLTAMSAANQVTFIAAGLTEPFNPQVPAAVTRLDFYGRELEIGAAAKDQTQLKAAREGLRKNWDKVRPAVKKLGGDAEAKKFDALVTQVEAAKTVEDFGKLATPILDEVDNIEKVFKK